MKAPAAGGDGLGSGAREAGAVPRLRPEVMVTPAAFRRLTSLIGLSMLLVLMASAVDAVMWTYQVQRRIRRQEAAETMRPARTRRDAGLLRTHVAPRHGAGQAVVTDEGAPRGHGRVCMYPRARD